MPTLMAEEGGFQHVKPRAESREPASRCGPGRLPPGVQSVKMGRCRVRTPTNPRAAIGGNASSPGLKA
jgi:hypothetical protein